MEYRLRGWNEGGDPVEVVVETCWRCGLLVNLGLVTMDEHVDRVHPPQHEPPVDDSGRHALD